MSGTIITVSPRARLADLERQARSRLAQHGMVEFAAVTADTLQRRRIVRLAGRLSSMPGIAWTFGDRSSATTCLYVWREDVRYPAWRGEPKTG